MFELNESISNIVADKNRIIEIFRSVNDSQVQIPGFDSQNSSSFVVSLTENGEIKIYIFLFLKESLKGIVYTTDEKIKKNNYVDMRNDAIFFLESMGFMLENMDFRKLPDEEKDRIIKTLPPFVADLSELAEDKKEEEENDPADESDEAEIVVEEIEEENFDTIPEYEETVVENAPKVSVVPADKLNFEDIKDVIDNDRNFKLFLLFLSGF